MRLLLTFICLASISCSPDYGSLTPEYMLGTWQVKEAVLNRAVDAKLKKETETLALSVRYGFDPDFSYTIKSNMNPIGTTGAWKINPHTKEIHLITAEEKPVACKLEILKENEAWLHTRLPEIGKVKMKIFKVGG